MKKWACRMRWCCGLAMAWTLLASPTATLAELREDFSAYGRLQPLEDAWQPDQGNWLVESGRLVGKGHGWSSCVWLETPNATERMIHCDVLMLAGPRSWRSAGGGGLL